MQCRNDHMNFFHAKLHVYVTKTVVENLYTFCTSKSTIYIAILAKNFLLHVKYTL